MAHMPRIEYHCTSRSYAVRIGTGQLPTSWLMMTATTTTLKLPPGLHVTGARARTHTHTFSLRDTFKSCQIAEVETKLSMN